MKSVIEITNLSRCSGGNHYTAEVSIDGGKPVSVHFDNAAIEEATRSRSLERLVVELVSRDLEALRESKPDAETEKAAVIGKTIQAEVSLTEKQAADVISVEVRR